MRWTEKCVQEWEVGLNNRPSVASVKSLWKKKGEWVVRTKKCFPEDI